MGKPMAFSECGGTLGLFPGDCVTTPSASSRSFVCTGEASVWLEGVGCENSGGSVSSIRFLMTHRLALGIPCIMRFRTSFSLSWFPVAAAGRNVTGLGRKVCDPIRGCPGTRAPASPFDAGPRFVVWPDFDDISVTLKLPTISINRCGHWFLYELSRSLLVAPEP